MSTDQVEEVDQQETKVKSEDQTAADVGQPDQKVRQIATQYRPLDENMTKITFLLLHVVAFRSSVKRLGWILKTR